MADRITRKGEGEGRRLAPISRSGVLPVRERRFRRLALVVAVLALVVAVLGAWVRLTGAGLGCPDWPGCYGRMVVGPDGPRTAAVIDGGKAWREMVHRYVAGALGLAIAALALVAVRDRRRGSAVPLALPVALVLLVAFQAALGAWTVTLRLQPAVVVAHLLGGMAILGLLWRLHLGPAAPAGAGRARHGWLRPAVAVGVAVLALQIALGGWTSANYAALACPDLPTCHGSWWPDGDYVAGFRLWQESGTGFEGGVLSGEARVAVHMVHRVGAVITVLYLTGLCAGALWRGRRGRGGRRDRGLVAATVSVLALLVVQIGLGVSNVWLGLPLGVAVAHNAGAALMLLALLTMHHRSGRRP